MKLYLTSVSSCIDQIESFRNLINRDTRLVILPFSYHKDYINCAEDICNHFDRDVSNKESIYWRTVKPFIDAGIDPDKITIINQFVDTPMYMKYKITQPNTVVYLPGGFPENIVNNMHKYDLHKYIKECHVIVGESAGSMAPFAEFFVYKDQDYKKYKRFRGLGILHDKTIIPHFEPSNRDILVACEKFSKASPKTKIFCVMDGGYVVFIDEAIVEYNNVYRFQRKLKFKKKKLNKRLEQFVELLMKLI